jgi:hypothetical protein
VKLVKALLVLLVICLTWLFSPLIQDNKTAVKNDYFSVVQLLFSGFISLSVFPKVSWYRSYAAKTRAKVANSYHRTFAVPWQATV